MCCFASTLWVSMCEEKLMQYIYKSKFSNSPSHVYEILHKKFLIHQGSAGTGTVTDFLFTNVTGASMEHPHWLAGCMDQH